MGEVEGLSEIRVLYLALLALEVVAPVEVKNDAARFLF